MVFESPTIKNFITFSENIFNNLLESGYSDLYLIKSNNKK